MSGASALYCGHVVHQRTRPRAHRLRYRIFSLLLDLDEMPALARRLRFFSRDRFNLFAFHARDHLAGTAEPLRAQVERHLAAADVEADGGPIRLLAMPRILGFAFNPLSIWFCHSRSGALRAILYEVNNTFGQRHCYLIPVEREGSVIRQSCDKAFHVSPFMGMDMRYAFTVQPPRERLGVNIVGSDDQGPLIVATHTAARRPLTDAALLRAFVTYPLLTLKVVGGILWEAAKLWSKGVPVHDRPAAPDHPISITRAMPSQQEETACI